MKILLASPIYEDSFADNVAVALHSMGHTVLAATKSTHDRYHSLPHAVARFAIQRVLGDRPSLEETRVLKVAKIHKPDMVLSLTRGLHPEILEGLGRICPGKRVLWWGDPPAYSKRWGMVAPGWDAVFAKDVAAVAKLRLIGRRAYLLHEAMNPLWHRPVAGQNNDSIAVVGNSYAFRQAICLKLMDRGVRLGLYGSRLPVWALPAYRKAHTGKYIVREEKSRVFGQALGCLNTFQLAEGNSLNCRAFEVAGAGGLQLIEYRPAIEECFDPGKEVLAFSCFDELMEHIYRAGRAPDEMKRIREAAARRALAEHTYRHRLEAVFERLERL